MDRVEDYSAMIKRVLDEYGDLLRNLDEKRVERIYDDERGHYELILMGWDGERRIHGGILHVDIIDGKLWIQHDGTEYGVANDFIEAGVPKENIVLAYHSPAKRPYTGFAVG